MPLRVQNIEGGAKKSRRLPKKWDFRCNNKYFIDQIDFISKDYKFLLHQETVKPILIGRIDFDL